jgi:hypothetical protein
MVDINKDLTALDLEYHNKQRAHEQAHEINRGLTRLKKISSRPDLAKKKTTIDVDKTDNFIVLPIGELQAKNIEQALSDAGKSCNEQPYLKKAKKAWFKWSSK